MELWTVAHIGFPHPRAAVEKEDLSLPFVLDKVRCPGLWDLSAAGGSIYGSVTMYQGLDDRLPLFPHDEAVDGPTVEDNIVAAGNIKHLYTTPN